MNEKSSNKHKTHEFQTQKLKTKYRLRNKKLESKQTSAENSSNSS